MVLLRVAEQVIVAKRGEQDQRTALVGEIFAVLERHVEERPLGRLELIVEVPVDRDAGDAESQRVGRKLLGVATEHVARELVEQKNPGERGQRMIEEARDRKLALVRPQLEEAAANVVVELGVGLPPALRLKPEPKS